LLYSKAFVARDMHQENIIAAAEHPVPALVEVIFQGKPCEQKGDFWRVNRV
jgi:hypothetical protein